MKPVEFHRYEYTQYGKRTQTRYRMTADDAAERFTPKQKACPIPHNQAPFKKQRKKVAGDQVVPASGLRAGNGEMMDAGT